MLLLPCLSPTAALEQWFLTPPPFSIPAELSAGEVQINLPHTPQHTGELMQRSSQTVGNTQTLCTDCSHRLLPTIPAGTSKSLGARWRGTVLQESPTAPHKCLCFLEKQGQKAYFWQCCKCGSLQADPGLSLQSCHILLGPGNIDCVPSLACQ